MLWGHPRVVKSSLCGPAERPKQEFVAQVAVTFPHPPLGGLSTDYYTFVHLCLSLPLSLISMCGGLRASDCLPHCLAVGPPFLAKSGNEACQKGYTVQCTWHTHKHTCSTYFMLSLQLQSQLQSQKVCNIKIYTYLFISEEKVKEYETSDSCAITVH